MRRKTPSRTHLTEHACLVLDPALVERDPLALALSRCSAHAPRSFAFDPARVTCRWCRALPDLEGIAEDLRIPGNIEPVIARATDRMRSDSRGLTFVQRVEFAWLRCCRHYGAECPTGRGTELLSAISQRERAGQVSRLDVALTTVVDTNHRREMVERAVAAMPELGDLLAPTIDRALLALDVLEEAERLLTAARAELAAARDATLSIPIAVLGERRLSVQPERGGQEPIAVALQRGPQRLAEAADDGIKGHLEERTPLRRPLGLADGTREHLCVRENRGAKETTEERRDLVVGDLQHAGTSIAQDWGS